MKSFQSIIIAAILAAATAANEPVASPTFFKQELAKYEHQLRNLQQSLPGDRGGEQTTNPTPVRAPTRPTPGSFSVSMSYGGKGGKSGGGGKGGKSGSKGGKSDGSYSYSASMSVTNVSPKATKRQ